MFGEDLKTQMEEYRKAMTAEDGSEEAKKVRKVTPKAEVVYECERCSATLERWQQGSVTWCSRCQTIWDEGFRAGLENRDTVMEAKSTLEMVYLYEALCPYKVR